MSDETFKIYDRSASLSSETDLGSHDDTPEDSPDHRDELKSMLSQASTFNPWLLVDVVRSPNLTGLVGALTIDLCEEIPNLDLSATSLEESEDTYDVVNLDEIFNESLCRKGKKPESPLSNHHLVSFSIASLHTYFLNQSQRRMPGPLDELYPLTQSTQPKSLFTTPRTEHLMSECSLKTKESECWKKFKTLKSMEHLEIDALAEEIQSIAWRHYELDQYRLAEVWWRRFITACLAIPGHQPFKVLHACLRVMDNVRRQGKYNEALNLHQSLHDQIVKLVGPEHELAIISREKLAALWVSLGEPESELAVNRELLQISLLRFGTRSRITLRVLLFLGFALVECGQYREGETVLCLWVQLDSEGSRADRGTIDSQNVIRGMTALAFCLSQQRRYKDSECVFNTIERWFKDMIREDFPSCREFFCEKARVLKSEGRLIDSEEILRAILRHAPDDGNNSTLCAMEELADVLEKTGQQGEGMSLREKIFIKAIEVYGIQHSYSRRDCEQLGFCYAKQGRYEDAILHFQQITEKLALSNECDLDSRNAYIEDIRGWIFEVEKMREKAQALEFLPIRQGARIPKFMVVCQKGKREEV
jgi:tetratricopeptide (TPR) repeat protein